MKLLGIIIFALLSFTITAQAIASGNNLYSAEEKVASRDTKLREQLLPELFLQVLIKASGNPNIVQVSEIKKQLPLAQQYLQQYSYRENGDETLLNVQFQQDKISKLLDSSHQPVWSNNRPVLVTWIAVKDGEHEKILDQHTKNPIVSELESQANQRGLSLAIPLGDLDDLEAATFNDVRDGNLEKLAAASQRYGSSNVLLINFDKKGEESWSSHWELKVGDQKYSWDYQGNTTDLLSKGINQLSDALAPTATDEKTTTRSKINISITNINSMQSYKDITHYLEHLPNVTTVAILEVKPDSVLYSVTMNTSSDHLVKNIAMDHKLEPLESLNTNNNTLHYNLAS